MKRLAALLCLLVSPLCAAPFSGSVMRDAENVRIYWTNAPPCVMLEWSHDLKDWHAYTLLKQFSTNNVPLLDFGVKLTNGREFWRLRTCN